MILFKRIVNRYYNRQVTDENFRDKKFDRIRYGGKWYLDIDEWGDFVLMSIRVLQISAITIGIFIMYLFG